jgi:hypothetical protein
MSELRKIRSDDSLMVGLGLSAKALGNVVPKVFENDFVFLVDKTRYECHSIIAGFLSPRIAALQVNDRTLREFAI